MTRHSRAAALRLVLHRLHDQLAALPHPGPERDRLLARIKRARRHYHRVTWEGM